ncbi:MAG: 3-dehydroquinate synthase, partial [Deltaproteobacteria bacterium]|nr:3-dehydroquinate synthase [Deltaproteobacteria bacterium]
RKILNVRPAGSRNYQVRIGPDILHELIRVLPLECATVCIISDDNVAPLYAEKVKAVVKERAVVEIITFPAGEANKNRMTKEQIEDKLLAANLRRDCTVVALGGGVALDMAGFVASTFLRGVPWITLPTSLLAAVDASIGGKTGLNTTQGKNLIGAFHQPYAVLINLDFLTSLPAEEIDNGLAEMVKHAVIADADHLNELVEAAGEIRSLNLKTLERPVRRSVEIKAKIVSMDPGERNLRQVLNCGHTIGHAIELVSQYRIKHGLAVAAGLSVEAGIANQLGLLSTRELERLREVLRNLSLPLAPPDILDPAILLEATRTDKKNRLRKNLYSLPVGLGKMISAGPDGYVHQVDDEVVLAALEETQESLA